MSRDDLFKILPKMGCPPWILNISRSFHEDTKGAVVFDGSISDSFKIQSVVKQGCVLASTLFKIFFAVMLKYAFGTATEGTVFDAFFASPGRTKFHILQYWNKLESSVCMPY